MCNSCSNGLNRREFISKSLKTSGALSLAMVGGASTLGAALGNSSRSNPFSGSLPGLKKEPAKVMVAFLYPPAEVVEAREDELGGSAWHTWPGNQFKPEQQQRIFTSKIQSMADNLGVEIDIEPKSIYQKAKVDEFIKKAKSKSVDAVLIINFWRFHTNWSFIMATESAPAAIVYQPIGGTHQRPPSNLANTKGIFYIHSVENWDEIERGLHAVRAKKMLAQSRLLRVYNVNEAMVRSRDEYFDLDIVGVKTDEFNNVFDSIKADSNIVSEAMEYKRKARLVMDVEDKFFVESIRSHRTVNLMRERYGADAITIECLRLLHRKPCVSFSLNNENLIPSGCENAVDPTITMMLGRWLFERGGFMHNPAFDTSENVYFASHCTSPKKLHGPKGPEQEYIVRPFMHESPATAAPDVQWTPDEPVVLARYNSSGPRLGCWTGKVIESPACPPVGGCTTRVLVNMDKMDDVTDAYLGAHPILFWGTLGDARKLKVFAQMYHADFIGNF